MQELRFTGWAGGARAVAPHAFAKREAEVSRQLDLLLDFLTPDSVFLDVGSPDCELSLRAAAFAERVWCVEAGYGLSLGVRAPCNLRLARLDGIEAESVDIAFAEGIARPGELFRVLKPGGIFISRNARSELRAAGFRLSPFAFLPGRPLVARK